MHATFLFFIFQWGPLLTSSPRFPTRWRPRRNSAWSVLNGANKNAGHTCASVCKVNSLECRCSQSTDYTIHNIVYHHLIFSDACTNPPLWSFQATRTREIHWCLDCDCRINTRSEKIRWQTAACGNFSNWKSNPLRTAKYSEGKCEETDHQHRVNHASCFFFCRPRRLWQQLELMPTPSMSLLGCRLRPVCFNIQLPSFTWRSHH